MDAASVTSFCQVRELSFVEQCVRNGIKGAWFENRRRERKFVAETEIADFSRELRAHPLPRHNGSTFTT